MIRISQGINSANQNFALQVTIVLKEFIVSGDVLNFCDFDVVLKGDRQVLGLQFERFFGRVAGKAVVGNLWSRVVIDLLLQELIKPVLVHISLLLRSQAFTPHKFLVIGGQLVRFFFF